MFGSYNRELDVSNALNILNCLPNEELDDLLNDKSSNQKIDSLVTDVPQIKTLEAERDKLILENKHLAESNLSFESTLRVSKQQLVQSLQQCQTLKAELDKKRSKLRELSRQNSFDTTLAVMQASMAEIEEASDETANAFLKKELPIDQFLKDFNEKRKLYHARRVKVEKMPGEINKLNGIQPIRPAPAVPVLPFSQMSVNSGSGQSNSTPYPTCNTFPQPHQY